MVTSNIPVAQGTFDAQTSMIFLPWNIYDGPHLIKNGLGLAHVFHIGACCKETPVFHEYTSNIPMSKGKFGFCFDYSKSSICACASPYWHPAHSTDIVTMDKKDLSINPLVPIYFEQDSKHPPKVVCFAHAQLPNPQDNVVPRVLTNLGLFIVQCLPWASQKVLFLL